MESDDDDKEIGDVTSVDDCVAEAAIVGQTLSQTGKPPAGVSKGSWTWLEDETVDVVVEFLVMDVEELSTDVGDDTAFAGGLEPANGQPSGTGFGEPAFEGPSVGSAPAKGQPLGTGFTVV